MKDIKLFREKLAEIDKYNDYENIKLVGQEIFQIINKYDNLKKFYRLKLSEFYTYINLEIYNRDLIVLKNKMKSIYDEYELDYDEFYAENNLPVFINLINNFFECIENNNGLINSYISIINYVKLGDCQYLDFLKEKISFDDRIYNIDYIIFDMIFNDKFVDDYIEKVNDLEQEHVIKIDDFKQNIKHIRLIKIISTKIIKDFISLIKKNTENLNEKESCPLTDTEIEILRIRANWSDIKNPTLKNIGEKLNPILTGNNVGQKVNDIKNKLSAISIDDAIFILKEKHGIDLKNS